MNTSDGDFIDLDWWKTGEDRGRPVVILCHGLEGNSRRQYMEGMARAFHDQGWNVVAVNYRGCSGEPNLKVASYHSGATADLREILDHVDSLNFPVRALVGFSLGGNLILKYLGENPDVVLPHLQAAVVFSVPVDLSDSLVQLLKFSNRVYERRFRRKLLAKMKEKARLFPGQVDEAMLRKVRTLWDFDEHFTGPINGFEGAEDYYQKCSSRQFLPAINLPTLLISAKDDPFLGSRCYPHQEAGGSADFHLATPEYGGHVGFTMPGDLYWSEKQAVAFVEQHATGSS